MLSVKSIIALALAASGAMASDVYSTFYSDEGAITPNFDVANNGCFSVNDAVSVQFNQHANGPYCLSAWNAGGCPGDAVGKQSFQGLDSGTPYSLNSDIAFAGSFKWALGGC